MPHHLVHMMDSPTTSATVLLHQVTISGLFTDVHALPCLLFFHPMGFSNVLGYFHEVSNHVGL